MNFEQFKQKLEHGRKLPIKITTLQEKIDEQRSRLTYKSNSSQAISGSNSNHFENSMDKLFNLEDKLSLYKKELQHHKDCINNILNSDLLNYSEKEVIRLRYIDNLNWESISDILNWDYQNRYVYKVHNRAIQKIFSNRMYT